MMRLLMLTALLGCPGADLADNGPDATHIGVTPECIDATRAARQAVRQLDAIRERLEDSGLVREELDGT